jgi:serine/threonine protein kinase
MGVVYKARQLHLNRVVALKVIRQGTVAESEELLRFLAEAEAIARLQHPHIVSLFECGRHNGLPYFTLECVEGGSLASWLKETPLPPREAARIVEALARGIHFAHQHGIVHRDLKPGNVLLAGATPAGDVREPSSPTVPSGGSSPTRAGVVPKITDFGLAKRVAAGPGLTQTGVILGTPSYMAPEQARGDNKNVGPAADVYALGAILYECLTGRPPFRAATMLDTLLQVLEQEPVPPRQLQSKTPRDLETICLMCLRKEPARRYASAADLAEDLRRFQAGEPIRARPVGTWERSAKWVRRNPVVAGMTAAVALTLLSGIAVSTLLAFASARNAKQAQANEGTAMQNEEKAKKNEEKAVRTASELAKANAELNQYRDRLEETLARSLLRPLGPSPGDPNAIELEALWELAESPSPRVHLLFLEYALEGPAATRQLRNRCELAVHAAVGLDPAKLRRLEAVLLQRLKDGTATWRWQGDCAVVALQTIQPGQKLMQMAARRLADALAKETASGARFQLARPLEAVAARLGPAEAAALTRPLADALARKANSDLRADLAKDLVAVAARLEPAEAARLCTEAAQLLANALAKETDSLARSTLAEALVVVADRLEPAAAAPLARQLAEALARETVPSERSELA